MVNFMEHMLNGKLQDKLVGSDKPNFFGELKWQIRY